MLKIQQCLFLHSTVDTGRVRKEEGGVLNDPPKIKELGKNEKKIFNQISRLMLKTLNQSVYK